MNASFAAYASQFLNRQQQQTQASSLSSSQPLFFSFTTDNGSRGGNNDTDLDDLDDPHLRASGMSRTASTSARRVEDDDDEDPYLRLDEEDSPAGGPPSHSIPLLQSHQEPSHGWLAHHASPLRPESPLSTSSSEGSRSPPRNLSPPTRKPPAPPLPPPRTAIDLSLTESLLPRDGSTRATDAFSLPDPRHLHRGRRKYNDSIWTALWLGSVGVCVFFSILLLFITRRPKDEHHLSLPYPTLLHTVPLLTIITVLSAVVSYAHIFLLRVFVAPVVFATSVFIPATLFISALWAFVGSFMWDANVQPTWGETVGLRLFSIVPLVLSLLTARRLVHLPREIHTTSSLLTLATRLLVANPFLLALSPAILLATLLVSIPFVTLIFRLLLFGYFTQPKQGTYEYHLWAWAGWAIVGSVGVWMWCWAVARGILRVTTSGVIGAWYFADQTAPLPPPTDTHTIHAALFRATQPSLGTICLASLILTLIRLLLLLASLLRMLPSILPLPMQFRPVLIAAAWLAGYLEGKASALSTYALVYTGLTGQPFWRAAERAGEVTSAAGEARDPRVTGRYRRRFKSEPPLTLLTVAPLTLTFPFALTTYLFVAHTLNAPDSALGAALLGGGVTALVGVFCVGLVRDTADAVYMCYCIDKSAGQKRRPEVFDTFEYDLVQAPNRPPAAPQPQQPAPHQPMLSEGLRLAREPLSSMHQHEDDALHHHPEDDSSSNSDPEPFFPETQPYDAQAAPPPSYSQQSQYEGKRSGDLESGMNKSRVSDEEEEGEESQLFPGSDFF